MSGLRLAELLAGAALATDLGAGLLYEKGLRTCLVATGLAEVVGLRRADRQAVHHAALLHALGCTSHASENAAMFGDDLAFQRAFKVLDPGDAAVFGRQLATFGDWAGAAAQSVLASRFVAAAPSVGPVAGRSSCEVTAALGVRLRLSATTIAALAEVNERWDGLGIPDGRAGEAISLPGRVIVAAEQAVAAHATAQDAGCGPREAVAAARAEVTRRAGGHLDPDVASLCAADAESLLAALDAPDLVAAVVAAEPPPAVTFAALDLPELCAAVATFADLKGTHLLGHSTAVADLAVEAARLAGVSEVDRVALRAAALLHDVGRVAVPSSVWDRPGPLTAADRERVLLHPHWTARVLERCPALAALAPVAAAHHERLDGSGYHRGLPAGEQLPQARLLAAADVFSALTEPRPHRPAYAAAQAAALCTQEAVAGRLDGGAVAAVVEAAGLRRPRPSWPAGLTAREVDVLRLAARGLSNAAIAAELVVSDRTVHHHLQHIYDKIGRRTRAGAAVFAIEHGLLPPKPVAG